MGNYLEISQQFADSMAGKKSENYVFVYEITNDGRYVTIPGMMDGFPQDFNNITINHIELSDSDFPSPRVYYGF